MNRYSTTRKKGIGYIFTFFTVLVWGTTFIATKLLLVSFSSFEILVIRFVIGYAALSLMSPKFLPFKNIKDELIYAGAGLTGLTLYQLLENIALNYSTASNVSIIISSAPLFTAIAMRIFMKEESKPLNLRFIFGFLTAITGIAVISFNGSFILKINPLGDLLALCGAVIWALYSVLVSKINQKNHPPLASTRRIFFYCVIFIILLSFFIPVDISAQTQMKRFSSIENIGLLLFLGAAASALCFVTWNTACSFLGTNRTTIYIYLIPVVTVIASIIVLGEKITLPGSIGCTLTIAGLLISEDIFKKNVKKGA